MPGAICLVAFDRALACGGLCLLVRRVDFLCQPIEDVLRDDKVAERACKVVRDGLLSSVP